MESKELKVENKKLEEGYITHHPIEKINPYLEEAMHIEDMISKKISLINLVYMINRTSPPPGVKRILFAKEMNYTQDDILLGAKRHFRDRGFLPCEHKTYGFQAVKSNQNLEIYLQSNNFYFELYIFDQTEKVIHDIKTKPTDI